jgi:hypothetical protein
MIVDPDQKMTSKNGIFVVAELENDFCVLTAQWGENLSAMNLTPLYPNAVTTLDINFSAKKSLRVSAFDAFHPEVLQPVELEEIGNPEIHQRLVEGKGTLPSLSGKGLAIFETHPELPYLPTRQILSRNQSYLHLPQINSRWVQSIFHSLRVNPGPQMGQVVGFVPDEDFTAYIDGRPLDSTTGFYFDALGKPRDPSLQGSQGGGLFLFNLSPGFHTVSVTTAGTGKILLQMIFVDPQVVSTFYVRTH